MARITTVAGDRRRRELCSLWAWTAAVALAWGLTGCASTRVSENSELRANEGVVTIRVVNLYNRTLKHLAIRNLDTQQVYELVPQAPLGGDSYRFTGIVPAGRYEAKELFGQDTQDLGIVQYKHTLKAPLDRPANRFDLAAGGLANLGSIVFTPVQDNRFVAPREETPVAAREWLRYANPALAAKLEAGRETGWLTSVPAEEKELGKRQIEYGQSQVLPREFPVFDDKGMPWSVGKLGSVFDLVRGARYQTDTVNQLTSMALLADGRLIVAGEEGYIAVSAADRKSWRQIPGPASKAAVGVLVTQAPDGTVYLVSRTPIGVAVHAAEPDRLVWREVRRIERDAVTSTSAGALVAFASFGRARPVAGATSERLVVYTPDPELLSSLDFRTGSWEAYKPESRIVLMRAFADGLVYTENAAPAASATADYGKSWFEVDRFFNASLPVFVSRSEGYVLASPFNNIKAKPALHKTVDSGKTWIPVGTVPRGVMWWGTGHLMYDRISRRLGYQKPTGTVVWTQDEGQSWR